MNCSTIKGEEIISNPLQKWPTEGILAEKNMDLNLAELDSRIRDIFEGGAHYTVTSVEPSRICYNTFIQTGCGPNFEGGLISQCTCRHDIRASWYGLEEWQSKWLAGFTGWGRDRCGDSYLFYIMKIEKAFPSFKKLYDEYQSRDINLIKVKRADKNPFGDLYYPKKEGISDDYDINSYENLHTNHPHNKCKRRLQDVNYPEFTKRFLNKITEKHASLLLGHLKYSFLWKTPMIRYKGEHAPWHGKWSDIKSFLDNLEPVLNPKLPHSKKDGKSSRAIKLKKPFRGGISTTLKSSRARELKRHL